MPLEDAGPRILVVDDNEDAATMLAFFLTAKGFETRAAYDGQSALRLAAEFSPAIAFLDIGLPGMDGFELAVKLREVPGLAGIRLVAVTGYGRDTDRRKTKVAGFDDHLVKPIDLQMVEALVVSQT